MAAGAQLVFEGVSELRLLVSCQSRFNPSDLEWDRWLKAAADLDRTGSDFRILVVTEGGHPTKAQVERLKAANKKNPKTAIVSPSLALRFMGGALTFVNPTIRCFAPAEMDGALEHLGISRLERATVLAAVERLRSALAAASESHESSAR
jgi:hypothetical protein